MDWKTWKNERSRVVADSEKLAAAQHEAAIRESERRKVFQEQRDHALFLLRCGADKFCREAKGMGIDAILKTDDSGFSVTAGIQSAHVELSIVGRSSNLEWHVFHVASIKTHAGRKVDLSATHMTKLDEQAIPELMAKLLAQTL